MPNLEKLVEEGGLAPATPAMSYSSLLTGCKAGRKAEPLWTTLHNHGMRSVVLGWPEWSPRDFKSFPGVMASADFFRGAIDGTDSSDAIFPSEYRSRLARFCLKPDEIRDNDMAAFVPGLHGMDHDDPRIKPLRRSIGRAVSTHAAATLLLQVDKWDFMAVSYDLIESLTVGLAEYCQTGPNDMFYGKACGAAYGFSDLMLARIVHLAGPDTAILLVSGKGYRLASNPAAQTAYQTSRGFFCFRSPGVKADELVNGASLLDLAPTILHTLGIAPAAGMDGTPLVQAFHDQTAISEASAK